MKTLMRTWAEVSLDHLEHNYHAGVGGRSIYIAAFDTDLGGFNGPVRDGGGVLETAQRYAV